MSHEVSLGLGPPSPCPSDHPFNSASSSLSESSSSHRSQEDDISIVTGKLRYDTQNTDFLLHIKLRVGCWWYDKEIVSQNLKNE